MGSEVKYLNLTSFETHLKTAAERLPPVYAVISPCRFERKKIVRSLLDTLHLCGDLLTVEGDEVTLDEIFSHLNTQSILAPFSLLVIESCEKMKKNLTTALATYIQKPNPKALLLLSSETAKGVQELYVACKKDMVVCDLSGEKPWERKKRLEKELISLAAQKNKRLDLQTAQNLIDRIGIDLPTLEQEVAKLIAYVGDRKEIVQGDLEAISLVNVPSLSWQVIEELVLTGKVPPLPKIDAGQLFPLIGQLRYQLHTAVEMSTYLSQRRTFDDIQSAFPQMQKCTSRRKFRQWEKNHSPIFDTPCKHCSKLSCLQKIAR